MVKIVDLANDDLKEKKEDDDDSVIHIDRKLSLESEVATLKNELPDVRKDLSKFKKAKIKSEVEVAFTQKNLNKVHVDKEEKVISEPDDELIYVKEITKKKKDSPSNHFEDMITCIKKKEDDVAQTRYEVKGFSTSKNFCLKIRFKQSILDSVKKILSSNLLQSQNDKIAALKFHITQEIITDRLTVLPSQFKAFNAVTKNYDIDIGRGLIATDHIPKGTVLGYFKYEIINKTQWEERNSMGRACYMFKFNADCYADCYEPYKLGQCILSFANSALHLQNKSNGKSAKNNLSLHVSPLCKTISLKTLIDLNNGDEAFYPYQHSYKFEGPSMLNEFFTPNLYGAIKATDEIQKCNTNVLGNGLCGYMSLAQVMTKANLPLQMAEPEHRKNFKNILSERFLPNAPIKYQTFIDEILKELNKLGNKKLFAEPFWPKGTGFWLPSNYIEDGFLREETKVFLWSMEINSLDFYGCGSNQFSVLDKRNKYFTYEYWKEHYLSVSYEHIFYSNAHYYLMTKDIKNSLTSDFHSALDHLIYNLVLYIILDDHLK